MLNAIQTIDCQNLDNVIIPVEFVVLHYTAVDLQDTLDIFMNPRCGASAHIVIDTDGTIYELVACLEGRPLRAWHAGVSEWFGYTGFNDFSIGIELVNFNGNVFDFTEAQYASLHQVMYQLKKHYPNLASPERVLGHEHIAGFRGKADPGLCFDWQRFFLENYSESSPPLRTAACPEPLQKKLLGMKRYEPTKTEERSRFWQALSLLTETSIRLIHEASD